MSLRAWRGTDGARGVGTLDPLLMGPSPRPSWMPNSMGNPRIHIHKYKLERAGTHTGDTTSNHPPYYTAKLGWHTGNVTVENHGCISHVPIFAYLYVRLSLSLSLLSLWWSDRMNMKSPIQTGRQAGRQAGVLVVTCMPAHLYMTSPWLRMYTHLCRLISSCTSIVVLLVQHSFNLKKFHPHFWIAHWKVLRAVETWQTGKQPIFASTDRQTDRRTGLGTMRRGEWCAISGCMNNNKWSHISDVYVRVCDSCFLTTLLDLNTHTHTHDHP